MNEWSFFVKMLGTNLGKCEWVWEDKLRWLNPRLPNSRWQNSRWLPSSSWVRMIEWSIFCAYGVNQSWQVWVSLRGKTKMVESQMVEFKLAEFRMAAIIKLSQNEWVKFFLCKMATKMAEFNMAAIIKLSQNEWLWVRFNYLESVFWENGRIQDVRIQDGRIQDGCHHQVKWEWMTLSQIELVGVRVRVERECIWVNLRDDNKVSESTMADFKMAAIITFIQNEWVWVRLN